MWGLRRIVMSELIVGGTSGLGLNLAKYGLEAGRRVIATGRSIPDVDGIEFRNFDLAQSNLPGAVEEFVGSLPPVDSLVYAAGYFQEGRITDISDEQVDEMISVGGRGLIFFVKKLLEKQGALPELVTITSTSQWTPREFEPVYNFAKAGAAHLSNGLSLDSRIGKTLVVGPSGMATNFWMNTGRDMAGMMDPAWVAGQVENLRNDDYTYRFARILGAFNNLPDRVEVIETR